MKRFTHKIPLRVVKTVCMGAVLIGLFFTVSGRWAVAICMLTGSYLLEKNLYCCSSCGKKLDMKMPLPHSARCPGCFARLHN